MDHPGERKQFPIGFYYTTCCIIEKMLHGSAVPRSAVPRIGYAPDCAERLCKVERASAAPDDDEP
jgi:hypothetical protein